MPTKVVCAECMKMCCLGGKNSVVKGLTKIKTIMHFSMAYFTLVIKTKTKMRTVSAC